MMLMYGVNVTKGPSFSVESRPTSLCLLEMLRDTSSPAQQPQDALKSAAILASDLTSSSSAITALYLNVGLEKGVLLRVAVDPLTGDFSDARQRYLGPKVLFVIFCIYVLFHGAG